MTRTHALCLALSLSAAGCASMSDRSMLRAEQALRTAEHHAELTGLAAQYACAQLRDQQRRDACDAAADTAAAAVDAAISMALDALIKFWALRSTGDATASTVAYRDAAAAVSAAVTAAHAQQVTQ